METIHERVSRLLDETLALSPKFKPRWWESRVIRVFSSPTVTNETVHTVIDAMQVQIEEARLPVHIDTVHVHPSNAAGELIQESWNRCGIDDTQMIRFLGRDSVLNGRGNVIITTERFYDDPESWGASQFWSGAIIFTLHSGRQDNHDFLTRVAQHETMHLLGKSDHCDADKDVIAGFGYDPSCLMHWSCDGYNFCPKCLQFVHLWWQEMKKRGLL